MNTASTERARDARIPPGLPTEFAPADKSYALYEDIEYEEYWDDPSQRRQDALEKHLISAMLPSHGRRVIDVGGGYGRLAPCYVDRFDEMVLFDGSLSLLRQARETLGDRVTLVAGDVLRLPFKSASFDEVLSIRVLQHMQDLRGALEGMRCILAREGRLLFSYHNKRNAHRVMHFMKSRKVGSPFSLDSAEVSPTLISHHPHTMDGLLGSVGFSSPEYRGAVVLDTLARITERFGASKPSGLQWASFTGRHRLAPWLIGNSTAQGGEDLRSATSMSDLFECPACRGELSLTDSSFECSSCSRVFPRSEGIFDFRI